MSVILSVSVLVRVVAVVWSVVVMRKVGDRRILFFTAMLVLMTLRQILTLAANSSVESAVAIDLAAGLDEIPGLIVSLMAFMFVLSLEGLAKRVPRENSNLAPSGRVSPYPALAIGLTGIAGIVVMSLYAYRDSRDAIRQAVSIQNLALGRTVCSAALGDLDQADRTDRDIALDRLSRAWARTESPYQNTYLCVVGPTGRLDVHTSSPEMKGTDVGRIVVSESSGLTLMQLLRSHQDWSGQNTSHQGLRQLVGYHYVPSLDSLVAIHVPAEIVDSRFRAAVASWIGSMVLIGGLLLPLSLGLLFRNSRQASALVLSNVEALCESEARFRAIFEQAAVGVAQIDSQTGRILRINQRYCDIVGYSREEMLQLRIADITHPEDLQADRDQLSRLLAGEIREFTMEKRYHQKDGSFVWVNLTVFPLWQPHEKPSTHSAIVEDISQRKAAQEALRQSEQRYRYFVEQTAEGFYRLDFEPPIVVNQSEEQVIRQMYERGAIVECNDVFGRMYGYDDARQLIGARLVDFHGGPDVPENIEALTRFIRNGFQHREASTIEHDRNGSVQYLTNNSVGIIEDGVFLACWGTQRNVTEQKKVEKALRASEQKFRTIFEQAAVGVAHVDTTTGVILQANRRYCDILGVSSEGLVGRTWMELTHRDDLPTDLANMESFRTGKVRNFGAEKRLQRCDGSFVEIILSVSPMWQPGEVPSSHIAIVEDISQRKAAERALRLSEERYRSLVSASSATVWHTDDHGAFCSPQPSWQTYTGQPWEEQRDWGWTEMIHPDDIERVMVTWRQAVASSSGYFSTGRMFHAASGEYRHFEARAIPLLAADGSVREWVGATVDVHDRTVAEKQLLKQHETMDRILSTMLDGYILADVDGRIMDVNPAYCEMMGYSRDELQSMNIREFEAALAPAEIQSRIAMMQQHGGGRFETMHRHHDGHVIDLDVSSTAIVGEDAETLMIAAFVRNISVRKRAEEALRCSQEQLRELNTSLELRVMERTEELQRANEDLEAYAHSVAHDLRAPLRAMYGFAKALREDYADGLDTIGLEYTDYIESAAQQMDDLIKDLLEYSRIGRSGMSVDPVDLDDVVNRSLQQLETEIHERQAVIHIERPLGKTIGHGGTLGQVVANLVSNGTKFVASGVQPDIRIRSETRDKSLRLWVEDNGIGIAPEFQHKIFRVFERLHGVETYPGTGIGLAIVRRAVESMGGQFGVESELGHGSRFWVELPA